MKEVVKSILESDSPIDEKVAAIQSLIEGSYKQGYQEGKQDMYNYVYTLL